MQVLKIILAIFISPVAAFLQVGLSLHFFLNILLYFCFVIPGIIHALWLVLADK